MDSISESLKLSGYLIATHLSTLFFLPILSRQYTPNDFAKYAVFNSIVALVGSLASLRYEQAVLICSEEEIKEVVTLSAILSLCTITISSLISYFLYSFNIINISCLDFFLIHIGIFFFVSSNIVGIMLTRYQKLNDLGAGKLSQSIFSQITKILYFWAGYSEVGLRLGQISTWFPQPLYYFLKVVLKERNLISFNINKLKTVINRYSNFPKYSIGEIIASGLTPTLIYILLEQHIPYEAGLFFMGSLILQGGVSTIGEAFAKDFVATASNTDLKAIYALMIKQIVRLFVIGVIPLLGFVAISPWVASHFLGPKWVDLPSILLLLAPAATLQLLVSPISQVILFIDKQKEGMFIQIFGFGTRVLPLLLSVMYMKSIALEVVAVGSFIFYLTHMTYLLYLARRHTLKLMQ